jgi:F-type H+-transporting ATPase subunit gamma
MPSLKDLKNRIASVKSTQKITKAMQMVAAAKLRRAQEAAEAARPYAERMGAVLAGARRRLCRPRDAPALLAGTGKDQVHLLVVAPASAALPAASTRRSCVSRATAHVRKLIAQGKTVKILCVGRKGNDVLKRDFALIVDYIDLREVRQLGFVHADHRQEGARRCSRPASSTSHAVLFEFKSVISQVPTAQQIIPAAAPIGRRRGAPTAATVDLRIRAGAKKPILGDLLPRNISVQIFRALLEQRFVLWRADERHGQRHAQRRRHDRQAAR